MTTSSNVQTLMQSCRNHKESEDMTPPKEPPVMPKEMKIMNFITNNFDNHTHMCLYTYMHTSPHRDIKDICKDSSPLPDMF